LKRPAPLPPDGIIRDARVRVIAGPHKGGQGRVTDVFRRMGGEAHSTALVAELPSSPWVVASIALACLEVAQ